MMTVVWSLFSNHQAFWVAILIGGISPLVGMFLVVRRFSLLSDTLAHVSLLGVAVGMLFSWPAVSGAMLGAVLGGLGIERLRQSGRILSEATLAVYLSGSLAVALILFNLLGVNADATEALLFGDFATVSGKDVLVIFVVAVFLSTFLLGAYRRLFLIAYDEDLAKVAGVPTRFYNFGFMFLASVVIALTIKVVGVLLVSALIVLPVLAAMQWRLSFRSTFFVSFFFSEAAALLGFFLAWALHLPSGAAIALIALLSFVLSYLGSFLRR